MILKHFVEKFDFDYEKSMDKLKIILENHSERKNNDELYKGCVMKRHKNLLQALKERKT